ncbi:hypothetical protein ACFIOY_29795 [Bradyrhizobium sp. TZ2]
MIVKLEPFDIGILVAASVMALGAFCPLVSLPIVGSLSYMMGGRGDGVVVLGCSAAIIGLVVTGYRRTSAIFAGGALIMMVVTLARFASALSEAQSELVKSTAGNRFGALAKLMANSVGLEWGWILLLGGALGVIVLALLAPLPMILVEKEPRLHKDQEEGFAAADQIIADYLENRKVSPAIRNQSMSQQTAFGKRRN